MAKAKKPAAKKISPAKTKTKSTPVKKAVKAQAKSSSNAKAKPKAKATLQKVVKKVTAKIAAVKKIATKKVAAQKADNSKSKSTAKPSAVKSKPNSSSKLVDVSQFVTPLDDRLIVQLVSAERVTAGGLIIPDTVSDVAGHREGVVVAVGRGHRDPKGRVRPMDVRPGDKIVFSSMTGSKFQFQSADLMILRETDVMGVVG